MALSLLLWWSQKKEQCAKGDSNIYKREHHEANRKWCAVEKREQCTVERESNTPQKRESYASQKRESDTSERESNAMHAKTRVIWKQKTKQFFAQH